MKKLVGFLLAVVFTLSFSLTASAQALNSEWRSWPNVYTGRPLVGYTYVIQRFLVSYDYTAASIVEDIDGKFGPKTKAGVKYYQKEAGGLAIDGQCGPQTWGSMNNNTLSAAYQGGYIYMSYADACCQVEICRQRSNGTWWTNDNTYKFH